MPIMTRHLATKTLVGGSAEPLSATSMIVPLVKLQADYANAGKLAFGDRTLEAEQGVEYAAGDVLLLGSGDTRQGTGWVDLSKICVYGTAGDKVRISVLERG